MDRPGTAQLQTVGILISSLCKDPLLIQTFPEWRPRHFRGTFRPASTFPDRKVMDPNEYRKRFGLPIDIHQYCIWKPGKMDEYRNRIIAAILKFRK